MIQQQMPNSFVVLGAGAWGSALASHLARCEHDVTLWGYSPEHIARLNSSHINDDFLPKIPLPENLKYNDSISDIFSNIKKCILLVVVPSFAFNETLEKIAPFKDKITGVLWGSKGLTSDSEFLHTLCQKHLPNKPLGILAGPSFAKEVAKALPTAVTIATDNNQFGEECVKAFHRPHFRVYLSNDLVGAELGGVVKNVLAIAVGMCDGLGFGANARAALITRGLKECERIGEAMGMHPGTLLSMACLGDIVLTCTDNQSRNRRFGLLLGQGNTAKQAEEIIQHVVEGKANVAQLMALAKRYKIDMPICSQVFGVLYEGLAPSASIEQLLTRSPKRESE
jgi:glycerol-3-phosphate dehydrogenase (NAD(P)+)